MNLVEQMNSIPASSLSSPTADPNPAVAAAAAAAAANVIVKHEHPQHAPSLSPAYRDIAYTPSSQSAHLSLMPASTSEKTYNQYACIRCRRLKKKCSKELPKCANCDRQGECCEYVERKNKRKSSISNNSVSIIKLKKLRSNDERMNNDSSSRLSVSNSASSTDNETANDIPSIILANSQSLSEPSDIHHRRTISNPTKLPICSNGSLLSSDAIYGSSASFTKPLSFSNESTLPSPKGSNIRTSSVIQLPPIRPRSTSINHQQPAGQDDSLPPLTSYSLQQHSPSFFNSNSMASLSSSNPFSKPSVDSNILPSIPKQLLLAHPAYLPEANSSSTSATSTSTSAPHLSSYQPPNIAADGVISARKMSISVSPTSSSQRDITFLVPPRQILNTEGYKDLNEDIIYTRSNSLFDISHPNSLEQDILLLIFNKIGFIDESIFATFMNHNPNLNFERTLLAFLKLVVFLDQKMMMKKLDDFKKPGFSWNEFSPQSNEDYFASIEFLLIYTCAVLITNHQAGINNSKYHKSIFTMAYKLFQRKCFPITRVQVLRLMMLFEIISLLGDSDLDTAWFIQSNLSSFSLKWNLNRSLKKKNLTGITLSELEHTNRLFWSIFVADSLISSTLGQQPSFSLNDIDVPLPIAITKDEEARIVIQLIVINMSKIQSRIISELYVANAKSHINTDPERFAILSALRQDADMWYNECRVSLSKLPQPRQESKNSGDGNDTLTRDRSVDINLQNFAAWVSQEYYYTLTQLFKSSNLFPKPDTPNFTVISNATYQNTALLQDLILSKNTLNSSFVFYRFANTSLSVLICIYKEMFSFAECKELIEGMMNIWRSGTDDLSKQCYKCILDIKSTLSPVFTESGKKNDVLKLDENSSKLLLELIKKFSGVMELHGFSVSIDNEYLKFCESKE